MSRLTALIPNFRLSLTQVFPLHLCIRHLPCRIQCWSVLIIIHLSTSCSKLPSKDLCLHLRRKTALVQTVSKLLIACPFFSFWMRCSCILEWCESQVCHIFTTNWYHLAIPAADEFWHSRIWLWWFYQSCTLPLIPSASHLPYLPQKTMPKACRWSQRTMCYQPAYNAHDSSFTLTV